MTRSRTSTPVSRNIAKGLHRSAGNLSAAALESLPRISGSDGSRCKGANGNSVVSNAPPTRKTTIRGQPRIGPVAVEVASVGTRSETRTHRTARSAGRTTARPGRGHVIQLTQTRRQPSRRSLGATLRNSPLQKPMTVAPRRPGTSDREPGSTSTTAHPISRTRRVHIGPAVQVGIHVTFWPNLRHNLRVCHSSVFAPPISPGRPKTKNEVGRVAGLTAKDIRQGDGRKGFREERQRTACLTYLETTTEKEEDGESARLDS